MYPNNKITMKQIALIFAFIALALVCACKGVSSFSISAEQSAEPDNSQASGEFSSATLAVVQNPKQTIRVLDNLLRSIVFSSNEIGVSNAQKRGLDLGMSRGFSGSQAGKHLLGLSAASFANGPGK